MADTDKGAHGFFTEAPRSAQDNAWHLDPNCPALTEALVRSAALAPNATSLAAPSAGALALIFVELGRRSCLTCAYDALLDGLLAELAAPDDGSGGYHSIECIEWHTAGVECARCQTLTRYADQRGLLSATAADGHISLLRAGTLTPNPNYVLSHAMHLLLDGTTGRPDLPAISAPTWAVAAMLADNQSLLTALTAAVGLLTPPGPRHAST